ncbi:uncharacterized protein LOC134777717 [Penaeus indicus]|uniref:uncharacterized protein LOC134777717 n=1 Tax=Penaeus indicus TaxID=29960 RepID=UPI00300CD3AE
MPEINSSSSTPAVLPGEAVATQHRPLVCKLRLAASRQVPQYRGERKIRWWKLKEVKCRDEFVNKVLKEVDGKEVTWNALSEVMRTVSKDVLRVTSGKPPKADKDAWWWTEEVQEAVNAKRQLKKIRDQLQTDEAAIDYREACKRSERRDKNSADVRQIKVIKDEDGRTLTDDAEIKERWRAYFRKLLNEENPREERVDHREMRG